MVDLVLPGFEEMNSGFKPLARGALWARIITRKVMQLSSAQREMLCEIAHSAYLEIRQLAEAEKSEQAFELAAVFHELLDDVWNEDFSLPEFRADLLSKYQLKYPGPKAKNFVVLIDRIIAMGEEGRAET